MRIDSVALQNVLSFVPEQKLSDLRRFNLLIGKNGTGKSNTLRILGDLRYQLGYIRGGFSTNNGDRQRPHHLHQVRLHSSLVSNRIPRLHEAGDILIQSSHLGDADSWQANEPIVFQNGQFVQGNLEALKRQTRTVLPDWEDSEFYHSIGRGGVQSNGPLKDNAKLDFALSYIFDSDYYVDSPGIIREKPIRQAEGRIAGALIDFNRERWSQGMLCVAKMIQQMRTDKLLLIDEPELHLEPRSIRRFMNFLAWLATPQNGAIVSSGIVGHLERQWLEFISDRRESYGLNADEELASGNRYLQFVMASHSPVMIQEFLSMGDDAAVFDFDLEWMPSGFIPSIESPAGRFTTRDLEAGWVDQETLFTRVRRVNQCHHRILDNLGCKGSDILQCNGVVWVEGPSDIIYIRKWLEMLAAEEGHSVLVQGQNFEFQMYGGALLDSICLIKDSLDEEVEKQKLVEMFSFSRNAYLITDSDAVKLDDGAIADRSTFFRAKQFMRDEIRKLNQSGYRLGLWYAESDTELRTIEDYVDEASKEGVSRSLTKKVKALRIVDNWGANKSLEDFPHGLRGELEKLYECIRSWQR